MCCSSGPLPAGRRRLGATNVGVRLKTLEAGALRLDLSRRVVTGPGRTQPLAEQVVALLAYLMRRTGDVCGRDELLKGLWDLDFDPGNYLVDVSIRRRRLEVHGMPVETVRGVA